MHAINRQRAGKRKNEDEALINSDFLSSKFYKLRVSIEQRVAVVAHTF